MSEVIVIDEGSSGLELFSYGECDGWGCIDGSGYGAGCGAGRCATCGSVECICFGNHGLFDSYGGGEGAGPGGFGGTGRAVGTGSGHGRLSTSTSGVCQEYFLNDKPEVDDWLCPAVDDIVYCINKDYVYPCQLKSASHIIAWYTLEEAEAALAVKLLND